jgi:hypothetical protein
LSELRSALIVFVLLSVSAALGALIHSRLPERHRSKDSIDLLQLATGLLVTFAALMLGLVLNTAKTTFDAAGHDRRQYAAQLTQLDRCLSDYGPGTEAARRDLHGYTAAVIASTWPSEPRPAGLDYPDPSAMPMTGASPVLANLMNEAGAAIAALAPADRLHEKIAADCADQFSRVLRRRWAVIEDAEATISPLFYRVLVCWLMIAFGCLGLRAPPNATIAIVIMLCAVVVSSAMFVIADLESPYGGLFSIASTSMRDALGEMMRIPIAAAPAAR